MFIWTFFDHKDLGNHLLQLCPNVVKHPVYDFSGFGCLPYSGLQVLYWYPFTLKIVTVVGIGHRTFRVRELWPHVNHEYTGTAWTCLQSLLCVCYSCSYFLLSLWRKPHEIHIGPWKMSNTTRTSLYKEMCSLLFTKQVSSCGNASCFYSRGSQFGFLSAQGSSW
jgi:hypothetical protein